MPEKLPRRDFLILAYYRRTLILDAEDGLDNLPQEFHLALFGSCRSFYITLIANDAEGFRYERSMLFVQFFPERFCKR